MPSTNTRTTAFKRANPARFLGESDSPIKNLLPISITQGEHPPHLGEFGLTQGTPIPALRALLQRQTQQILRRHGILQEHRQLRPILPHITHNTTPNQHPHTQQHHTPPRPRNKTATNPTVHHAPIQPHHPPRQEESARKNATRNVTREQTPPTRPFRLLLRRFHTGATSQETVFPAYLDFAWVIPKAPWNAGRDKEDSTLSRYPRP